MKAKRTVSGIACRLRAGIIIFQVIAMSHASASLNRRERRWSTQALMVSEKSSNDRFFSHKCCPYFAKSLPITSPSPAKKSWRSSSYSRRSQAASFRTVLAPHGHNRGEGSGVGQLYERPWSWATRSFPGVSQSGIKWALLWGHHVAHLETELDREARPLRRRPSLFRQPCPIIKKPRRTTIHLSEPNWRRLSGFPCTPGAGRPIHRLEPSGAKDESRVEIIPCQVWEALLKDPIQSGGS